MKNLLCALFISILVTASLYGEEAVTVGGGNMRFSYPIYFGFETEEAADSDKIFSLGWGYGVEGGIASWLDFQLLWDPGVWGVINGNYAMFSDLFVGVKTAIVGPGALVSKDWNIRLASAMGINIPVYSVLLPKMTGKAAPSQSLWGSVLRVYADFIVNRYFYFNFYGEGIFYPAQRSNNMSFAEGVQLSPAGAVEHWLDITGEIGMHFEVPLEGRGITLKGGAPVRIFYAPWLNAADSNATNQWRLTVGGYFGVFFTERGQREPLELILSYSAPIQGMNVAAVHRASFIIKIYVMGGDTE
jgi:hypothetical protein